MSKAGSVLLGYALFPPPPYVQLNVIDSSFNLIASPFERPWPTIFITISPVAGSYVVPVTGWPTVYVGHLNSNPFNFTVLGDPKPNPCTFSVVTVIIPVVLSYAAVWIPSVYLADVPKPTIPLIDLLANLFVFATDSTLTLAPTKGAYPRPGVDPRETIRPPLGSWFWLISNSDWINCPFSELIPVNTTLDTPTTLSCSNS